MIRKLKHHFHPLTKLEKQRQKFAIADECSAELRRLLNTPLPKPQTLLKELDFLVMDFETTGIDAKKDSLLSIGSVAINDNQIDMHTSAHCYVDDNQQIKAASAVVNHITPQMLLQGDHLDEAMNRLFLKMIGKVAIAHGAAIEKSFIDAYVQQRYGIKPLPIIWLDTLRVEKHLTFRNKKLPVELQLNDVRKRYNLPAYSAHNALADALSTAELFFAQKIKIFGSNYKQAQIGQVYCRATCFYN